MITGQITFNGLMDDDIVALLEIKKRQPKLAFIPTTLQATTHASTQAGQPGQVVYNNAVFHWQDEETLNLVKEVLRTLTGP